MSDSPILPGAHAWRDGSGKPMPVEFYRFLRDLVAYLRATNGNTAVIAEIEQRLAALEQATGTAGDVQGVNSVYAYGTLADGTVWITLQGDTRTPGPTYYYGTGPDGERGWYAVSDTVEAAADELTKTVDANGVTTFGLADVTPAAGGTLQKYGFDAKGRRSEEDAATTDDLDEGATNLYFTDARVYASVKAQLVQGENITITPDDDAQTLTIAGEAGGGGAWGEITGTLSDQTDLQAALDEKANTEDLSAVATSGSYNDLTGTPTIPPAQVNADWNATSTVAEILNKPTLGTAAATDASDYATAAQGALADSALQSGDNVSELVNDAGYIGDAPSDGAEYVRQDGAWVERAASSIQITAGESLGAGDLVYVASDGLAYKADNGSDLSAAVAFTLSALAATATGTASVSGVNLHMSGLTTGTCYALGTNGGVEALPNLPTLPGSIIQVVGIALSPGSLLTDIQPAILRG